MPDILTKQDGPILRVTLNQPERGNAVFDEMVADLARGHRRRGQDVERGCAPRSGHFSRCRRAYGT